MPDLDLTRHYAAPPEEVFRAVTDPDMLAQWWGPEGVRVESGDLDFTRTGAWGSVMINGEGGRYKVTGQVTHVDPPRSVGFTWAWHDDEDRRGHESNVTFTVQSTVNGARLILTHRGLDSEAQSLDHERGWLSTLSKLDRLFT